jgi:ComF family protein
MEYPEENTKKPQTGGSNYGLSEATGDKSILAASTRVTSSPVPDKRWNHDHWQRTLSWLRQRLSNCAELLPSHCLLCHTRSRAQIICPACSSDLPPLPAPHCPQCLENTTFGERCGRCLAHPPFFDGVFAAYAYDFPVDKLIHSFKYGQQLALSGWFAAQLTRLLRPWHREYDWNRIMPVPLHRERLRERGFNQTLEIARPLAKALAIPCDSRGLSRIRGGAPQASLPLQERLRHLHGAFSCRQDYRQQRVLLLDDVLTSGSTTSECARVLKLHGAESVHVAVIARALRH